jgi:hypothetical protein
MARFKSLWQRLSGSSGRDDDRADDTVEYEGRRIRPAPFRRNGQYQTAGIIEKEVAGETRQHRFVRAESHPTRDGAIEFSIAKAKQIIDERGPRVFD